MGIRSAAIAASTAGILTFLLSGCAASAPAPSATGTTVASMSAEPTTPATDAADSPTCDTVLTSAEYASLAEDGHALDDSTFLLGPAMERMDAADALMCSWSRPNGDVTVWYGRLEVGDEGEAWITELEAEGWLEDTVQGDGSYQAPADYDPNYQPSVLLRDGVLHFVSYNPLLLSVAELQ
ncbi:hypothetical protein [Agromyces subbeticus]|uniref:hypothetical protein n=1 Tax=Agromyces subbeticus TaxID=293890 RepID=UPI0003B4D408|nr:hypothetical protein [Agromyces subbeticus]